MRNDLFSKLGFAATLLTLCVVVLGAFVRLSDAGLGCPDWPGCYGHLDVPKESHEISAANEAYPERPVEAHKAWKEMVHRYFAGTLGLLIFAIAILALKQRREPQQQVKTPLFIVALVIFQALLGMWTVTLLLKPVVVMSHLMGGMATLSLLWWISLRHSGLLSARTIATPRMKTLALIGLIIVVLQIMLGGWTSANYAALACPDFPTCQTYWWPPTDFGEAFTLWRGLGVNYEFGVLDNDARVTIHLIHRIGAVITFLYLWWMGIVMLRQSQDVIIRRISIAMMTIVTLQFLLGIGNVVLSLPLAVAVAHNGVAAILLLSLVSLNHALRSKREGEIHG
ncbi:MAG: COX15/CtaA family protein [Gammaproteobacteria bacterium]|nr:COX15/CtaA family protein [Gammaproteobacteria bacterium]